MTEEKPTETKSLEQYLEKIEKGIQTFDTRFEKLEMAYKSTDDRIAALETKLNTPEMAASTPNDFKMVDEAWKKDFLNYVVSGKSFDQNEHVTAFKDFVPEFSKEMISTNLTTGGYWMPFTMSSRIIEALVTISPFRSLAAVETLRTGDRLQMVGETAAVLAGWTSEGAARAATLTDTLYEYEIPTHPMYAMPTLTDKMAYQAAIDVEAWLVRKVSEYFAFLEGVAFLTGTGVGRPEGISTRMLVHCVAATEARHSHTTNATLIPDMDCLIDMQDKLNEKYQPNACWLMNRTTKSVLRRMTDGMGDYILQENVTLGQPDQLFGKPIYYMPAMTTVTTAPITFTTLTNPIIYGDIKQCYQIVDVPGMRAVRDEISTKGLVQLYTSRLGVGGQVVDDNAFVGLYVSA